MNVQPWIFVLTLICAGIVVLVRFSYDPKLGWDPWLLDLFDRFVKVRVDSQSVNSNPARSVNQPAEEVTPPDGTESSVPGDTYQLISSGIQVTDTSIIVADTGDLIRVLSAIVFTNGNHAISANKIDSLVEMSRNDVLAIVKEIRGTPEPVPQAAPVDPNFPELSKNGRVIGSHLRVKRRSK